MGGTARRRRSREHAADPARQQHHRRCRQCAGGGSRRGGTISRLRSGVLSRARPGEPGHAPRPGVGSGARLGARFLLAEGIVFVTQPVEALTAARAAIPRDIWQLGALNSVTTLTGSALIALALAGGALTVDQAWTAAHVDEDWNMDIWGRDALALERRAYRFAEMQAAAKVLQPV